MPAWSSRPTFELDNQGRLIQILPASGTAKGKGKGKGYMPQENEGQQGWQQQKSGWTCKDHECVADRKKRGLPPLLNRPNNTHCYHCGTEKSVSLGSALTEIQAASVALKKKKAAAAAEAANPIPTDSSLSSSMTKRQRRNAKRAAAKEVKEQKPATQAPPPPPNPPKQGQSSPVTSVGGTAVDGDKDDVIMTEVEKKHMILEAEFVKELDLVEAVTEQVQQSLAKGTMPKPAHKMQSRKERLAKWMAHPEATAKQSLEDAEAKVKKWREAKDFPPPGASDKWMADTAAGLAEAEAALAKLQKRPTDAASSVAALENCKTAFMLAVAKTKANVEAAQKNTEAQVKVRKDLIAKAREQLEKLEQAIDKEMQGFLEAHRLRGIQRSQQQDETIEDFDAEIAAAKALDPAASVQTQATPAQQQVEAAEALVQATAAEAAAAKQKQDQTIEQLAEQLKTLQQQMQQNQVETTKLREEASAFQSQQAAMRRYLMVVPVDEQELPEVVLPAQQEPARLYYMQLHLLLDHWQAQGCVPFTEVHLREQFPNHETLKSCVEAILGTQASKWHLEVRGDSPDLVMPNQMAMVLYRQLQQVLPTTEQCEDDAADIERLTKRASETYTAMVANAKRYKYTM